MGDVNKAEVRDLLVDLFQADPAQLRMWAATVETFPGLNGLVAGIAWTNAMTAAFNLVNAIDARGGFAHAETRARIAKTLTDANPLRAEEIELAFGLRDAASSPDPSTPRASAPVSLVDRYPLDYSQPDARELRDIFAIAYRSRSAFHTVLEEAGVPLDQIDDEGSPRERWTGALKVAAEQRKLRKLVDLAQQQRPALEARLGALAGGDAVLSADNVPNGPEESAPDWKAGVDEGIERILADASTLLDLAFLRRGIEVATSVVHITTHFGMKSFMGTAFRVGPRHLLTNHHNVFLGTGEPYRALDRMTVRIGYEVKLNGQTDDGLAIEEAQPEVLASERSKAPARDWALVRLSQPLPDHVGTVDIAQTTPPEPTIGPTSSSTRRASRRRSA